MLLWEDFKHGGDKVGIKRREGGERAAETERAEGIGSDACCRDTPREKVERKPKERE